MQIFITRGEDSSGPYTLEQVQDYLSQGVLLADDFAYHEGLEGWIPLEQLIAKSVPLEEPPHPAQMAEETPPSKPEPVLAEAVRTPVKGKGKKKIVMAAVAGLLVFSALGVGAWFLLKDDPVEQVQNQEPASPPPATGTPEPNLPPPPTTNPSNPDIGKSGTALWEFKTGDGVGSSPALGAGGTVYVGSRDKKLYAINGKTGDKLWEFVTGGSVSSSTAIGTGGILYVGSSDKKLYAFRTDSKGLAKSPWPMRGQNPQHTGRAIGVSPTQPTEPNPTNPDSPGAIPALPAQPNNSKQ